MDPNTGYGSIVDARRAQYTPLYDTLKWKASTATGNKLVLFGSTAGASGIELTNMLDNFQLPAPNKFTLNALRIVPVDCALADWLSFLKAFTTKFIKGGDMAELLVAPPEYFAGGAGVSGFASTTATTTTIQSFSNGVADPRAIAGLGDMPIVIQPGNHFEVQFVGSAGFTPTADGFVRVYLDGKLEKEITA